MLRRYHWGLLLFFVAAMQLAVESHAIEVSYTVDPQRSFLQGSALVTDNNYPTIAQSPGADKVALSGQLIADLNGVALTFTGNSDIFALSNPAGPFYPIANGHPIENLGFDDAAFPPFYGTLFSGAVRNAAVTIVDGTISFGQSAKGIGIGFTRGVIDYDGLIAGSEPLTDPRISPPANQSTANLMRSIVGNTETVTLPFRFESLFTAVADDDSILYVSGQIVASRTLPNLLVLGDFNRDGQRTKADIPAMLAALTNLAAYKQAKGLTDADLRAIGDLNGDYTPQSQTSGVNNRDIQALLNLIASEQQLLAVPEPCSIYLLIAAAIGVGIARLRAHPCHRWRLAKSPD
jgi:hypothetical protein